MIIPCTLGHFLVGTAIFNIVRKYYCVVITLIENVFVLIIISIRCREIIEIQGHIKLSVIN